MTPKKGTKFVATIPTQIGAVTDFMMSFYDSAEITLASGSAYQLF